MTRATRILVPETGWMLRVTDLAEFGEAEFAAWDALVARARRAYPFQLPEALRSAAASRPDAVELSLAVVEHEGRFALLMPVVAERGFRRLPYRVLSNRVPFLLSESVWRMPLVDPELAEDAFTTLLAGLRRSRAGGIVDLDGLYGDGPEHEALLAAARRLRLPIHRREHVEQPISRRAPALPAPTGPAPHGPGGVAPVFVAPGANASSRKRRARAVRDLRQAVGGELELHDAAADPAAIERFFELERAGWKGDEARGGHGYVVTGYDRWFVDFTDRLRDRGRLHVYELRSGGRLLYSAVLVRIGAVSYGIADEYDESLAQLGLGTLGRAAILEESARLGAHEFDPNMSADYAGVARRLYHEHLERVRLILPTGGFTGRAAFAAIDLAYRVRDGRRGG